jgi:small Trp-rich protein
MPMILLILALVLLRYFEVWRFAQLSWGWIIALMALAFVWFEYVEPMLGLDKKKAHDEDSKRRADRMKQTFDKGKAKK